MQSGNTDPNTTWSLDIDAVMTDAIKRLLDGAALEPFCDWFSREMATAVARQHPLPPGQEADGIRYQRTVARALWSAMPVPGNRWRPRLLPKPERNSPCHCGSGRKYKQCCAEFEAIPLPHAGDEMYVLALAHATADMLNPDQARQVPPEALGAAAQSWNSEGRAETTAAVLEPLFEEPAKLDGRHEFAFDMLLDALQVLGQETRREALARRVAALKDRDLSVAARSRLISMLADRGDSNAAWALFHETQRAAPDNPQLWHLEMTLLLAEGRQEEARLRGPLLAAKARRAGMDELADLLARLAHEGLAAMYDGTLDDELDDAEDRAWVALADGTPEATEPAAAVALYEVERTPSPEGPDELQVRAGAKLRAIVKKWRRQFPVAKPMLTARHGDAGALLDDLDSAAKFLASNPLAWSSMEVLDDLLLAGAELSDEDAPAQVLRATRRIAGHGVAILHALTGTGGRLEWAVADHRPLLRVLACAIDLAALMHDLPEMERLVRWGLDLNPNDNHGWRMLLAPLLLEKGRYAEALALTDRYPDDFPEMSHHRALALFAVDRAKDAEAQLRLAHADAPRILQALLPDVVDPPAGESDGIVGGEWEAWHYRNETRAAWVRSGALAWARELAFESPKKPRRKTKTGAPAPRRAAPKDEKATAPAFNAGDEKRLRRTFPDYARLRGPMTAVTWSPELVMPNQWLVAALGMRGDPPDAKLVQLEVDALMRMYNDTNDATLAAAQSSGSPIEGLLADLHAEEELFAWAAGFVQGAELASAGWQRAGRPVRSTPQATFGELYRLAARAGATSSAWRATTDGVQPMLAGIDAAQAPREVLDLALRDLWRVVGPLPRAGGGHG